jgi:hypothetical protein
VNEDYYSKIIYSFPYPIVSFFIQLRTDECLDFGPLRLRYILSTAEAICRFLGIVSVCECREYLENHKVQPPKSMSKDFQRYFSRPTWGGWLEFTRRGQRWLKECNAELTLTELPNSFVTENPPKSIAALGLDELSKIRNGLSHEQIKAMNKYDFKQLCMKTFPLLEQILESLEFLLKYDLSLVNQIEVNKPRKNPPMFLHKLSKLIGGSDTFQGDRKFFGNTMDSEVILLMNAETEKSLNLDPLLVFETSAGKAPDIFYYNGIEKKDDGPVYSGCKHGGMFISKGSERAQIIIEEFNNIIHLFTLPPGGGQ